MPEFPGISVYSENYISKCFSILISDYEISEINFPDTVESHKKYFDKYEIYDKHHIKQFLKDNFDKEVLNAYESLNANAYKADLASYCILKKIGGWYSAITNTILMSPPEYLINKDMVIFRDIQKNSNSSWAVTCHPIYSKPNNKVFDIAIENILRNVAFKRYNNSPLCITGPCVIGRAIAIIGDEQNIHVGDFVEEDKSFVLDDGSKFAFYKKFAGGEMNIKGTNNYNNFWNNKNLYVEMDE